MISCHGFEKEGKSKVHAFEPGRKCNLRPGFTKKSAPDNAAALLMHLKLRVIISLPLRLHLSL